MTNADWVNYQRYPHHDVTARVLKFSYVLAGWSSESTNGVAYVDLALINNGNQSEIIRGVTFYYCANQDSTGGVRIDHRPMNTLLAKGNKEALHLILDRDCAFTGKTVWLSIGVTAIGPNAEDLESKWQVTNFTLATDGNGGQTTSFSTESIRVVSNERLPNQREQAPGMMR